MRATGIDNSQRSGPHRRVEKILDGLSLSYMSEFPEFPPYILDIYLPEWHLGIEVDGPYHLKKHDKVRDQYLLERFGVIILRLKMKIYRRDVNIGEEITDFIDTWAGSENDRKQKWLTLRSKG